MVAQDISGLLRKLSRVRRAPTRSEYEAHLRAKGINAGFESLEDRPDLALPVYRDWQRRAQIACVFARRIAVYPERYDIAWEVIDARVEAGTAESIAATISETVEPMKGQEDAVAILLPGLTHPQTLVRLCKALGRQDRWSLMEPFNPSDRLDRMYVRLTTDLAPDAEAEILGFAPFEFLPITRRSPIVALQIRTKADGAKHRGRSGRRKSYLAHIEWPRRWLDPALESDGATAT